MSRVLPRMKETPSSLFVTIIGLIFGLLTIVFLVIPFAIISAIVAGLSLLFSPTPQKLSERS